MSANRITTPFGFDSTAAEVIDGIDLSGRRAIVTGGSSGIGVETARALAGAEVTLAVRDTDAGDHVGHFALALGLHEAFAAGGDARIVSLSSVGHPRSPVIFDDINFSSRSYTPGLAYGQSKTANVLFAVEASRRWGGDGITANAVQPGPVATTNLLRGLEPDVLAGIRASAPYARTFDASTPKDKTVEQGAATSVVVATSPQLDGTGGRYFEDCNEADVLDPGAPNATIYGVAAYALDPAAANRLWEVSPDAVG
jgi:NAD(P)-dependent dehydrogenase (short-subunit alcohol dehydrogenase family)